MGFKVWLTWVLVIALIANLALLGAGKISELTFWLGIVISVAIIFLMKKGYIT